MSVEGIASGSPREDQPSLVPHFLNADGPCGGACEYALLLLDCVWLLNADENACWDARKAEKGDLNDMARCVYR
jgi:hypothetical protein